MRIYRAYNALFLTVIALVTLAAFPLEAFDLRRERLYPLTSWQLFALSPDPVIDYSIEIIELDGHTLSKPQKLQKIFGHRIYNETEKRYLPFLIKMAIRERNSPFPLEATRVRRQLEKLYLGETLPLRYYLVREAHQPGRLHGEKKVLQRDRYGPFAINGL